MNWRETQQRERERVGVGWRKGFLESEWENMRELTRVSWLKPQTPPGDADMRVNRTLPQIHSLSRSDEKDSLISHTLSRMLMSPLLCLILVLDIYSRSLLCLCAESRHACLTFIAAWYNWWVCQPSRYISYEHKRVVLLVSPFIISLHY